MTTQTIELSTVSTENQIRNLLDRIEVLTSEQNKLLDQQARLADSMLPENYREDLERLDTRFAEQQESLRSLVDKRKLEIDESYKAEREIITPALLLDQIEEHSKPYGELICQKDKEIATHRMAIETLVISEKKSMKVGAWKITYSGGSRTVGVKDVDRLIASIERDVTMFFQITEQVKKIEYSDGVTLARNVLKWVSDLVKPGKPSAKLEKIEEVASEQIPF